MHPEDVPWHRTRYEQLLRIWNSDVDAHIGRRICAQVRPPHACSTAAGFAIRGVMGKVGDEIKAKMYEGEEELDGSHTTAAAEAANDTIAWWNKHTA